MDKDNTSRQNLLVRNYSLENAPAGAPGKMFVNPGDVYVLRTFPDGAREFTLWTYSDGSGTLPDSGLDRPNVKVTTFVLRNGEVIAADRIVAALRKAVFNGVIQTDPHFSVNTGISRKNIIVRYLSPADLTRLISVVARGLAQYGEIIAVSATTVPHDANIPIVDIADIISDIHTEDIAVKADFDVKVPPISVGNDKTHSPAPRRRPTLQEIEDEHEPEIVPYHRRKKRRPNYILLAFLAVVALVAAWAVVSYLPTIIPQSQYTKGEEVIIADNTPAQITPATDIAPEAIDTADSSDSPVEIVEESPVVEQAPPTEQTVETVDSSQELLQADIQYLNANKIWNRNQLKSDKYRDFFDLFAGGDILAIAQSDYFAVPGQMTNPTAQKTIDMLWKAYKTGTENSNKKVLKALKGNNKINLQELYDKLSRYQDAKPNKSPRPQK